MEKGVGTYTFDSATKYDTLLCTMIYYHFGKFVRYLDNPPGVDKCRVRSFWGVGGQPTYGKFHMFRSFFFESFPNSSSVIHHLTFGN